MKRNVLRYVIGGLLVMVLTLTLIGACSQPAPSPTPAPKPAPAPAPAPTLAPAPSPSPSPAPKPSPSPAPAAIKWQAITGWSRGNDWVEWQFIPWMDAINKATGGRLVVELKGGPEAVAPTAQMKPLSEGIYQVLYTSTAYYAAEVPAATFNNCIIGSPEQLRAVGFYDIMDKMHAKKANAKFLMNGPYGSGFAVYLNKPITKADYTGFRIRATGFYKPLIDGLGGSTVGMPASDIYLAMQQKTVDGFTWPLTSFLTYKWQEVTKYIVKPYFGEYCGSILINLDAWNKLPADLQDIVAKTTMQRESDDRKKFAGDAAKEVDGMLKAGMQIIDLPKAEADKYLQVFWDRSMAEFSKADPEFGPQLKAAAEKLLPQPRW